MAYNVEAGGQLYDYLTEVKEYSPAAAAGFMSNALVESSWNPGNWENQYEQKYGMTDAQLFQYVDEGKMNDQWLLGGMGLTQLTYKPLKKAFIEYAQSTGRSVGDYTAQIDFVDNHISSNKTYQQFKNADDPVEAAKWFYTSHEMPGDDPNSPMGQTHSRNAAGIYETFTGDLYTPGSTFDWTSINAKGSLNGTGSLAQQPNVFDLGTTSTNAVKMDLASRIYDINPYK